jgi:hypothetical protein
MPGPLRRFLHLERARPEGAAAPAPDARARFDALEVAPELPEESSQLPASAADRFRAAEDPLGLDLPAPGEQPFVRCGGCEADNARHAALCGRCGAALDTPEQRAFNERLWAARQREAEEERRAAEVRRDALEREREEARRLQRAAAEAMADEILRRERLGEPWFVKLARRMRGVFGPPET